jgi:hypothetical protein
MYRQSFLVLEDRFGVTTHAHHLLIGLLDALSIVLLSVLLREVCEELLYCSSVTSCMVLKNWSSIYYFGPSFTGVPSEPLGVKLIDS